MHLKDVLSILEDSYPLVLHKFIVYIFGVVLKDGTRFPPYALSQLKPISLSKIICTNRPQLYYQLQSYETIPWPKSIIAPW